MRTFLPLACLAALSGLAGAQQILVPNAQAYSNTGTTTAGWRTTLFHFQMQYDDTLFTAAGVSTPITITRLRFRMSDGVPNTGGQVYSGVTVKMAQNTLDYSAMSTTFATNLATPAGGTVVFGPGTVTVGASAGSIPNSYAIDITLTPSFVYDPTLGDLVIDVDAPTAPVPANLPATATSSLAAHKGRRLSTATASATTGALSDFAAVCLIDFTGGGGYTNLTGGQIQRFGVGCDTSASSFYEAFNFGDGFDLSGGGLTLTPSGADNYTVTAGARPIQDPSGSAELLSTADDAAITKTLPFTHAFPGGSTTTITACTNGFVWLGTNTSTDFSPTTLEFRNQMARLAPYWHDFHAGRNTLSHPGAGLWYEYDATTNPSDPVALVTWKDVGLFRTTTAAPVGGHSVNNFQVAIHKNSGVVEFRYGTMGAGRQQGVGITGFARGGTTTTPAADPFSRDLSREVPFTTTGPDGTKLPLQLGASPRPSLGATVTVTTSNIPATVITTYNMLSAGRYSPGIDLGFLGAANCKLSLDTGSIVLSVPVPGTPTASYGLPIPGDVSLIALTLFSQSACFATGVNPFGVITSNALALTIGHL